MTKGCALQHLSAEQLMGAIGHDTEADLVSSAGSHRAEDGSHSDTREHVSVDTGTAARPTKRHSQRRRGGGCTGRNGARVTKWAFANLTLVRCLINLRMMRPRWRKKELLLPFVLDFDAKGVQQRLCQRHLPRNMTTRPLRRLGAAGFGVARAIV